MTVPSTKSCTVAVAQGLLRGADDGTIARYWGVPYAAPPVGPRRFRAPEPAEPWEGERDASVSPNVACPRVDGNVTESYNGPLTQSEDCLLLNVFAPSAAPSAPRPVLVWLHGGGFRSGSAFQSDFDGGLLAQRGDIVVVTVNYRLGVFGYLELGELDPSLAGSGNNGLRDQLAALRWVRDNAAAFGGDPDAITVAGESAGAISIGAMLAGDRPQELFRRAVMQSGSGYLVHSHAQSQQTARSCLKAGGVRHADDLHRRSTAELVELQRAFLAKRKITGSLAFAPYVDGDLVPDSAIARVAAGSASEIDLLIGTNRDEASYFTIASPPLAAAPAVANPFVPGTIARRLPALLRAYRADTAADSPTPKAARRRAALPVRQHALIRIMSDQLFRVPATRTAEAQSRHNARVFMYRFDWQVPDLAGEPRRSLGATHVAEVAFVFGGLQTPWLPGNVATAKDLEARRRVSDPMMAAWLSFVRTGDPSADADMAWPAYEPSRRTTMIFGSDGAAPVDAPGETERRAWDAHAFDHRPYALPFG